MDTQNNKLEDFDTWYEEHQELIEGDFLTRKGLARLVWGTVVVKLTEPDEKPRT